MAALATPVERQYVCTPATGAGVPAAAPTMTVPFGMEMVTPGAATPHATVTVNWRIVQPSTGALTAPAAITPTATIVADATVTPSGSPAPSLPIVASGAVTPYSTVTAGSPLPIPTMNIVVTPTATGTIAVKGDAFALKVNNTTWYNCAPHTAGGGPSMAFVVGTGTPTSTSTSTSTSTPTTTPTTPTPTPTPTKTTATPKQTKTSYVTVVETPTKRSSKTPKAGANTGAGGEMGPDGRMFVLVGSALILAAGAGGLAMRRRGVTRG
ncbi:MULTISPECIES: hypothetical protein [unclassified Nonomuraea]|uniref:hypothetical protein n=1 Tax=unclassified Nonomuraea TaxID=2593643 RepID=UPI0033C8E5C3